MLLYFCLFYIVLFLQTRFEKIENDMYLKFHEVLSNIAEDKQQQVLDALKLYNEACRKAERK